MGTGAFLLRQSRVSSVSQSTLDPHVSLIVYMCENRRRGMVCIDKQVGVRLSSVQLMSLMCV